MKHNAFTALSLAAALVVAGSAEAAEFEFDFESYEVGATMGSVTGWSQQTDDASAVFATNGTSKPGSQALSLDTGDEELIYTPTSTDVSILTMDVCFVGADSAPTLEAPFTAKTALYLDTSVEGSPVLKATTDGMTWTNLTASVTEGQWYKVQMKFAGTEVEYFIGGTSVGKATLAAAFTKVTSVGFKGTGFVDNFVGDKAGIPGATTTDGTNETAGNSAAYNSTTGVVTGDFAQEGLQFIRVYDSPSHYVTLRVTDPSQQTIQLPNTFGTPTKVVAYYGAGVTATDGITPEATNVAVDNGTVTVSFAAKSGVYYWLKDVSDGVSGNISLDGTATAIAPNAEGVITLTFDADSHAWGVKKFQLVVDDNPPPAAAGN